MCDIWNDLILSWDLFMKNIWSKCLIFLFSGYKVIFYNLDVCKRILLGKVMSISKFFEILVILKLGYYWI